MEQQQQPLAETIANIRVRSNLPTLEVLGTADSWSLAKKTPSPQKEQNAGTAAADTVGNIQVSSLNTLNLNFK